MKSNISKSFLETIIQNAISNPNQLAVTFKNKKYSYKKLVNDALLIAKNITSTNLKDQEVVALLLPPGYNLIRSQLGVLLNKKIFVALDINTPKERLKDILLNIDARLIITENYNNFSTTINQLNLNNLKKIESIEEEIASVKIPKNYSAYIISTSGTTGKPKNVEIPHSALCHFCKWHAHYYNLTNNSIVSSIASVSFDASIGEIWPALTAGASIIFPDPEKKMLPSYLINWITNKKINHSFIPTPLADIMIGMEWPASCELKTMVVAGAKMYNFPTKAIPFKVYNNYGPSEYTVCTTSSLILPEHKTIYNTPTIGKPIQNTIVYILNKNLEKVKKDNIGELYIEGHGLAKGYYKQDILTNEKFIQSPFSNSKLYKTGDLGRWNIDGNIEFHGRIDNQIKINGNRIEIEEITSALKKHPEIKDAFTKVFFEDPEHKKTPYLVSYFSPKTHFQSPGEKDIYTHLEELLPKYMLPSNLILIHDFSLNKNGKIDTNKLPNPEQLLLKNRIITPPKTTLQKELANIWCAVLKTECIGVNEDFFYLGGNSLAAIKILEQIRVDYNTEITIKEFWENATIHQITSVIKKSKKITAVSIVDQQRTQTNIPLSIQQEQVWFLQKYAPKSNAYNAQTSLRIKGKINAIVLEKSVQEIFNRHELLRTTYKENNGKPQQLIHSSFNFSLNLADLRHFKDKEQQKNSIKTKELTHIFNLTELPLCRFTLIQIDDELFDLLLVEHHMVHDGVSYALLMNELNVIYNSIIYNKKNSLTKLPIQYADYSIWQRNAIAAGKMDNHLEYWYTKLHDAPKLIPLPIDNPRPKIQSFKGDQLRFDLPLTLSKKIKTFSKEHRITLFSTMFTAFALLLHKYTSEKDICIGSAVGNRHPFETENLIGMFVNAVVIRCLITNNSSFKKLAHHIQKEIMDAHTHQSCPFPLVVKKLNIQRDLSYNPIFQTMFSFHDASVTEPILGDAKCTIHEEGNSSAKQDIDIVIIPKSERYKGNSKFTDNRISVIWEYNKGLFNRNSMEKMAANYQFFLELLIDNFNTQIENIPAVNPIELKLLENHLNAPNTTINKKIKSFEEILENLIKYNNKLAIYSKENKTTYATLYDNVKKTITYLSTLNLKEGDIIGLHLNRGAHMITSQVACLVYGVAFSPIDTTIPNDRKKHIISHAKCKLIITEQSINNDIIFGTNTPTVNCTKLINNPIIENIPYLKTHEKDLAYVIYTSGSTGTPKGVMISREALINYINWHITEFAVSNSDISTLAYSSGFDASLAEIWPYIASGSTLYNIAKETLLSPAALQQLIINNNITISDLPTPLAEQLIPLEWPSNCNLRILLTGGQKLTVRPSKDINWKLYNQYGPTETTITATSSLVTPKNSNEEMLPNIGKPITNISTYVLDSQLNRVPIGGIGELYIGGKGLALGYLNDTDLTQKSFIKNPFTNTKEKLYKTGDLVRVLHTKDLHFIGRNDTQVKLRGFRIELDEISKITQDIPEVTKAHTIITGNKNNKQLITYFITETENTITEISAKEHLKKKLPHYMVPTHVIFLKNIPLTDNGKINEKLLPPPNLKTSSSVMLSEPNNETEKQLIKIWKELLEHPTFSTNDNFFDIGGHSLKIVEMQSLILQNIGVDIPTMAFFEYTTITNIAKYINGKTQIEATNTEIKNSRAALRKKGRNKGGKLSKF